MRTFIVANVIVVAILVLRRLFEKKLSNKARYAMWLFLPLYILLSLFVAIPVSGEAVPSSRLYAGGVRYETNGNADGSRDSYGNFVSREDGSYDIAQMYIERNEVARSMESESNSVSLAEDTDDDAALLMDEEKHEGIGMMAEGGWIYWIWLVYVVGVAVSGCFYLVKNVAFVAAVRRERVYLSKSEFGNMNIYVLDTDLPPFLFGGSIYVSRNLRLTNEQMRFALCHEYCHFKHGDTLWNIVKCIFIVLMWFDPLIYFVASEAEKDAELAADEAALEMLGVDNRRAYGKMLLDFSTLGGNKSFIDIVNQRVIVKSFVLGKKESFLRTRVKRIVQGTNKSVAATLIVALIMTSFVGCSLFDFDKRTPEVSAEDEWYSYQAFNMKENYKGLETPYGSVYVMSYSLGMYGDEFVHYVDVDSSDDEIDEVKMIEFYDESGAKTREIDVAPLIGEYEEYYVVVDAFREGDVISFVTIENVYNFELETSCLSLADAGDETNANGGNAQGLETLKRVEHSLSVGGVDVEFVFVSDLVNYYEVRMTDADGNSECVNLMEATGDAPIYHIRGVFPYDERNLVFVDSGSTMSYYKMDVITGEVTKLEGDEIEFLDGYYFENLTYFEDSDELIGTNDTGFYRVDFDDCLVEQVFDWNWCFFDRTLISMPQVVEISEERIVVMDEDSNYDSYVLILMREETNPNAGKKILTIDGTLFSSQVAAFNEIDEEYFIEIDNRYSREGFMSSIVSGNEDDEHAMYLRMEQELSNQIAIDLMAGESPDIICNAYSSSQLMNSDLLYDMSELVSADESYSEEMLFTNVIEASRVNGKLLYMPLTFGFVAIGNINVNYADVSSLSFEEYAEFVSSVCGGKDPIATNRNQFVELLTPSVIPYCFDEEGNVDFDNEAFRALMEYARDEFVGRADYYSGYQEFHAAANLRFYSLGDYLTYISYESWNYNNVNLISYPHQFDTGLPVEINSAVSISANTSDPEGCYRFVQYLISTEAMLDMGMTTNNNRGSTTINRDAFDRISEFGLANYNEECEYYLQMQEDSGMSLMGVPLIPAGSEVIDNYRSLVERCEYVNYVDQAINLIIYEESQPYFAEDKTLDEIIVIMNDRAQTVLDER